MTADNEKRRAEGYRPGAFVMNQIYVLHALILHDIKSRWFGNGIGWALSILWPMVHIVVIVALNAGRVAPYGSSMILYAAVAVIPYIACNYIGRFMLLGVIMNRAFLQYPIIKPLDLMISRAYLEVVGNFIGVGLVLLGISMMSIDVMPVDVTQAALAWCSSVFLGISFGIFSGTVVMAYPMFNLVYVFLIILVWVTCGIAIDPEVLPVQYGYWLSFNPVLHAVEWMKLAYYPNFHARLLDKSYLLTFGLVCLCAGLVMERTFRSFWMRSR